MATSTPQGKAEPAAAGVRLLDGESPGTADAADASHWHQVYAELVRFTEEALALSRDSQATLVPEGAWELDNDLQLITRQLDRLRKRLEFWDQKLRQLAPETEPVA
ncbi:MAG TPA: hypothetical protein VJO72_01285 [Candidatus Dormibacteraeota bacterium]|nr:hypothetical protein [Candidatus Dormibacteraeota bacterium]